MKRIVSLPIVSLIAVFGMAGASVPRCAEDDLQRQVCTTKPVQRVISLAPGVTELAFAAGGGAKVIAVDEHSDYPEAVKTLPKIGGYPNISAESILAKRPDLVLIWSGGNDSRLSVQLENIGLNVFYADPSDFNGVASVIRRLGKVMGTEAVAEKNADAFNQHHQSIRNQYSTTEPVYVFFEIWDNPLMTVNGGQIISESIALCGGVNVFADARPRVPQVGIEAVLAKNPEAIVSSEIVQKNHDIRSRWQAYPQISAVKNDFLFTIPGDLITRPTPRALNGAEVLCQQLQSVRTFKNKPRLTHKTAQGKH